MKKTLLRTLGFIGFAAIAYLIHQSLLSESFSHKTHYSLIEDYSFITLSCLCVIALSSLAYQTQKRYASYTYLGASLLKMIAAMLFLFQIRRQTPSTISDFVNFTTAYFLLLAAELAVVLKLFKKPATV